MNTIFRILCYIRQSKVHQEGMPIERGGVILSVGALHLQVQIHQLRVRCSPAIPDEFILESYGKNGGRHSCALG